MGQFASSLSLSMGEIITLTDDYITPPGNPEVLAQLELIAQAFEPVGALPQSSSPDGVTGNDIPALLALLMTNVGAIYRFQQIFPGYAINDVNAVYGTVLNCNLVSGDTQTLTDQIEECFAVWGLPVSVAPEITALILPQVIASDNTPTSTFGTTAAEIIPPGSGRAEIVPSVNWIAEFAVFDAGQTYPAVIFGFAAMPAL